MKYLWQTLMMVRRSDRGAFGRRVLYVLLQSLLPLAMLLVLRQVVDAVTRGATSAEVGLGECVPWLAAMAGLFLIGRALAAADRVNHDLLQQRVVDHVSSLMQAQAARLDLSYYDTPEYHDTYHRAQQEATTRPLQVADSVLAVAGAMLSAAGVLAMLAAAAPWTVAVLLIAVAPSFWVRLYKARSIYSFRRRNTQLFRRAAYYSHLLTAAEAAKEMRVYGLQEHFRKLYVEVRGQIVRRLLHISRRVGWADVGCAVVEAVALLLVVAMLASRTVGGSLTLGAFVMLFEAFRRGQSYLTTLVAGVATLYDNRLFVSNLFEFLWLQPSVTSPDHPLPLPNEVATLALEDVTFRYPGMEHDVLHRYSLTAHRGEVLHLKGANGYGKTTVIKLLLRLYDPQQGRVLLNGTDVRLFPLADYRRLMGVLFQDFVRYQCTLDENIAFGNLAAGLTPLQASLRWTGVDTLLLRLPQGGQTQLGRMFDGGQELSMGQWQRVALARAVQSDAQVLLLDEPLAWIDAAGREAIKQQIEAMKQEKIIIIISHE